MRKEDIHIGDVLRIRRWEDMEAEFGIYEGDERCIDCAFRFTTSMKPLCGQKFTVKEINYEWSNINVKSKEGVERLTPRWRSKPWKISSDMLEPWTEEEVFEGVPEDSLFGFLMGSEEGI